MKLVLSQIGKLFLNRRWRDLFLYQFIIPLTILIFMAFFLGLLVNNLLHTFLMFAYDGEFLLISILLIVGMGVELRTFNSPLLPTKDSLWHYLWETWIVFAFVGLILYVFNKISVFTCINCSHVFDFDLEQGIFILANLLSLIATPLYCVASILAFQQPVI